jgi:ribosomal protein S4
MKKLNLLILIAFGIISCTNEQRNETKLTDTENSQNEFIDIVNKWNLANNEKDVAVFSELYSEKVDFYKTNLSKNECIEKKLSLFKKYPDYYQQIFGKIEISNSVELNTKLSFIKKVTINGKTTDYPSYLIVSKKQNELKIVAESDFITDKNLTKNENTEVDNNKQVKYSEPEEVLEAIFFAARTKDFSELKNLCDPQEKGDVESLCACRLSGNYNSEYANRQDCSNMTKEQFVLYFRNGKNPRVVKNDGIYATVEYDAGNVSPNMQLVKRGNRWYIFILSSNEPGDY